MTEIELYGEFIRIGMTPAGAAGALANCLREDPPLKGNNLQDSYNAAWHITDEEYTRQVDAGTRSFIDCAGYGLFQHTANDRKRGLKSYCDNQGKSVSNEYCQIQFAAKEMRTQYTHCWNILTQSDDPFECGYVMCKEFEIPANTEYQAQIRGNLARQLYEKYSGVAPAAPSNDDSASNDGNNAIVSWPPRMIDKGMSGPDVTVLQAILVARGYTVNAVNGVFDGSTDRAIRKYQADNRLAVDGVVGNNTWRALLAFDQIRR